MGISKSRNDAAKTPKIESEQNVYQIELEMQNTELRRAQEELETKQIELELQNDELRRAREEIQDAREYAENIVESLTRLCDFSCSLYGALL